MECIQTVTLSHALKKDKERRQEIIEPVKQKCPEQMDMNEVLESKGVWNQS